MRTRRAVLLAAICVVTYLPALNNGFIADDYVYLEWATKLKTDIWFLFRIPPNNFLLTSFIVFLLLKSAFGYRSEIFYAFNILLHLTNCILLWRVMVAILSRGAASEHSPGREPGEGIVFEDEPRRGRKSRYEIF